METKKSYQANLDKKRTVFFQIGILLALGFVLAAFKWQVASRISDVAWEPVTIEIDVVETVVRTFPETPPPPPPPQPSFILEIVDDGDVIIDIPDIFIDFENGYNIIPGDFAESVPVEEVEPEIFCVPCVEVAATFNGKPADEGLREYMGHNLKYPHIAVQNNISGRVIVQFVVDQNGNAVDVQVIRGTDPLLDSEASRLIKSTSGMWTPGMQRGKPVKVRYTFPVLFQLQ